MLSVNLMLLQGLFDLLIQVHFRQQSLVGGFAGLFLLHRTEHTVIQVLIEALRVTKSTRAGRAFASGVTAVRHGIL